MNWRDDARRRVPRRTVEPDVLASGQFLPSPRSWRSIGAALISLPGALRRVWSRSLQLRVAATTLLVTGVFVFVIGVFLVNQLSSGVLRAKRTSACLSPCGWAGYR